MISICMATYNGERFIKEQLESILSQLGKNGEIVISDDGSTDSTIDIIKEFNDPRIRILFNNSHCYTANFENALSHAKGEYIFLCDQDDIWNRNKIKITLDYLQTYDFVVSNARVIDENLNVKVDSRNDMFPVKTGFIRNILKTYYLGCCMAFRRCVLDAALPFPDNRELCYHDSWIAMVAELCFKTYVCNETLVDYRRHGNNVSAGSVGITSSVSRMIKIRRYLLCEALRRRDYLKREGKI